MKVPCRTCGKPHKKIKLKDPDGPNYTWANNGHNYYRIPLEDYVNSLERKVEKLERLLKKALPYVQKKSGGKSCV